MEFQYRNMMQEIADMALDNATINNVPFREWINNVNNACENKKCNLNTCRYNENDCCTNGKKERNVLRCREKYYALIFQLMQSMNTQN